MAIVLLLLIILALFFNLPIAMALAVPSVIFILIEDTFPLESFIQTSFDASNSFPLLAVPLFILAGEVMSSGGVAQRIIDFAKTLVQSFTGGLGYIAIIASLIFGAISGSGTATAAAIGSIMIPIMKESNYKPEYSASIVASSGSLGAIIPPSIVFILYGVMANVSIASLFIAGVIPGLLLAVFLGFVNHLISKKDGYFGGEKSTFKEFFRQLNKSKFALLTPVVILGGIYAGVFTPTESATIAIVYCSVISVFVYKEISFKDFPKILMNASITSGGIMIIVGISIFFGRILSLEQIPQILSDYIQDVSTSPTVVLFMMTALLIVVGMFMETVAGLLIFAPILLPVVNDVGIDPLHFGIIITVTLAMGLFTPPIGIGAFITARIADVPFSYTYKYLFLLVLTFVLALIILILFPQISLFLPNLLE